MQGSRTKVYSKPLLKAAMIRPYNNIKSVTYQPTNTYQLLCYTSSLSSDENIACPDGGARGKVMLSLKTKGLNHL